MILHKPRTSPVIAAALMANRGRYATANINVAKDKPTSFFETRRRREMPHI
jgi:hypothetical protein